MNCNGNRLWNRALHKESWTYNSINPSIVLISGGISPLTFFLESSLHKRWNDRYTMLNFLECRFNFFNFQLIDTKRLKSCIAYLKRKISQIAPLIIHARNAWFGALKRLKIESLKSWRKLHLSYSRWLRGRTSHPFPACWNTRITFIWPNILCWHVTEDIHNRLYKLRQKPLINPLQ